MPAEDWLSKVRAQAAAEGPAMRAMMLKWVGLEDSNQAVVDALNERNVALAQAAALRTVLQQIRDWPTGPGVEFRLRKLAEAALIAFPAPTEGRP